MFKTIAIILVLISSTAFAHGESTGINFTALGHVAVILAAIVAGFAGWGVKTKNRKAARYIVIGIALLGLFHLAELLFGEAFEPIEHDVEHVLNFLSIAAIGVGLYKMRK